MVLEMSEKSMGDTKISYYLYHSEAPAKVWEAARLAYKHTHVAFSHLVIACSL